MTRTAYILLGLIALLTLIFLANGHWLVSCPFHQLTGWECPFCGGQRMLQAILCADWQAAFDYNPFLMCSLPLVGIWLIRYFLPKASVWKIPFFSKLCSDRAFFIYLLVALFWGILRNI